MASAQAMAVNDRQQKEIVHQMVEKAKSVGPVGLSKPVVNQSQGSAVVSMSNNTTTTVNFNQNYNWSGNITSGPYPPTIVSGYSPTFTHKGVAPNGSSGAVVYYGFNKQGTSCAWLLAWSAPTDPSITPNKVYVHCGPSSDYKTIDWKTIQSKLNVSDSSDGYWDPDTQTRIMAQISAGGSFAAVGVNFGLDY